MDRHDSDGRFSAEPLDAQAFTSRFDRIYSRLARPYDLAVKFLPVWRRWLSRALPHIQGPRVLEVSFGTGWLLTHFAADFEIHGVDLNERMVEVARNNMRRAGVTAELRKANVEALPYPDGYFDTVVNTMAFSGYPNGKRAMAELHRVLRPGGRIVLIDVSYPRDRNWIGGALISIWKRSGDVLRDMPDLFESFGFDVHEQPIGGFDSIHLYIATKR